MIDESKFKGMAGRKKPVGDVAALIDALGRKHAAHVKQWDEWWAAGEPARCPKHTSVVLAVNREASLARSFNAENEVVLEPCPSCVRDIVEAKENAWMAAAGIPDTLRHCTVENWTPQVDADKTVPARVLAFQKARSGFLLLFGKMTGIGKTHLAVACMRAARGGLLVTQEDLLKGLRKGYDDRNARDIVTACKTTRLFVLDEIGLSTGGSDELPMLHGILNHRVGAKLKTILTGNVEKPDELEGILGFRIVDRLREATFATLFLGGTSKRSERRKEYLK